MVFSDITQSGFARKTCFSQLRMLVLWIASNLREKFSRIDEIFLKLPVNQRPIEDDYHAYYLIH